MIVTDIKMAMNSIKSTRIRSFLTMLGVIIGVTSVVMIVSLGQGVKNQVISQIHQSGKDVITVRPGTTANELAGLGSSVSVSTSTLTEEDLETIVSIEGVADASKSSMITGNINSFDTSNYNDVVIIAASANTQKILGQKIEFGEFYGQNDTLARTVVIGSNIADALFKQRDPIGRVLNIKGQEFAVRGILAPTPENPLNIGVNYNDVIYMPIALGQKISGGNLQISEINARIDSNYSLDKVRQAVQTTLVDNHNGQEDFVILEQDKYLNSANQLFNILTSFVAAIAGISLLVGGIGIMNIMLVSVSERTHEIGVRKALGATNAQILNQFLVESTAISVMGGVIGVLFSLGTAFIIRLTTSIHPSISLETILIATGASTIVGIIFGITPAIKAAKKDPIDALRHE